MLYQVKVEHRENLREDYVQQLFPEADNPLVQQPKFYPCV